FHVTGVQTCALPILNTIPKIVFSRTLSSVDWTHSTLVQGDASEEIAKLKTQGTGDMYVYGSSILSETLINANLFDEYRIGMSPRSEERRVGKEWSDT